MPISTPLTLASNIGTSPSHSISPSQSRLDNNDDFQSNATFGSASPGSDLFYAGLGIAYHQQILEKQEITSLDCEDPCQSLGYPISPTLRDTSLFYISRDDKLMDDEFNCLYQQGLASLWSPSCSMSGVLSESADIEHLEKGATLISSCSKRAIEMDFSSIAAASGMSVGLLAEHLSATANLALQYMGNDTDGVFPSLNSSLDELVDDEPSPWPILPEFDSETVSYKKSVENTGAELPPSVNPSKITTKSPNKRGEGFENFVLPDVAPLSSVQVDQKNACQSNISPPEAFSPALSNDTSGDYEDPESERPSSDSDSSPFPSPRQVKKRTRLVKHKRQEPKKVKQVIRFAVENLSCHAGSAGVREPSSEDIDLGTPVLDAHRGIDIAVLKAKAERYRLRNPGRMYDNSWLVSFAGKLSSRGELVKEFRCYISGCSQTNKRRDHILIHVGSHLDQRPFACAFCPSQFFRKNECKRHELSHSGAKPFVCTMCPDTAFVRQDLLKRHAARAHGIVTARKRRMAKEQDREDIGFSMAKRMKKGGYA